MKKNNLRNLAGLQKRKAELSVLCKEKEKQMGAQIDYIGEHLGYIALRLFTGGYSKKNASSAKSEIISLIVSEGIDVAFDIQKDPHNLKDKAIGFIKKTASGIIELLVK